MENQHSAPVESLPPATEERSDFTALFSAHIAEHGELETLRRILDQRLKPVFTTPQGDTRPPTWRERMQWDGFRKECRGRLAVLLTIQANERVLEQAAERRRERENPTRQEKMLADLGLL